MGCCLNKFVFASNSAVANVPTNGVIPLGTVASKAPTCRGGCALDGNGITCQGPAYFKVTVNVTLEPLTTEQTTLGYQLELNGNPVQSGDSSITTNAKATLPLSVVVSINCCSSGVLTLKMTGSDAKVSNVSTIVEVM